MLRSLKISLAGLLLSTGMLLTMFTPTYACGGASCSYGGNTYSHGSVLRQDDGNLYLCDEGNWGQVAY
jgi:hypothetical protein